MFFIRQDAELTSDGTYSLYAELSSDIDGDAFWLTMSGTGSADYVVPGIFLEMDDYREMFEYAYDPSGMFAVTFEGEQTYNGETQKISGYVEYYAQGESPETPQASTLDLSIWLEDEEKVVLAGTAFHGYWWPADGVTYDYDEFYADLMLYTPQDDFNAELLVQNRHSGGQDGFYASLNLTDWLAGEAHSLYCQYDGSYEDNRFGGEDMRGTLELGYSQGLYYTDTQTQISLDVELQQVALADVRFPALEGEAVDVFAMSDAETEKLTAECSVIGIQLLGILSANAPGAAELLADLIMQGVL